MRIVCSDGSNSRLSSPGVRPALTRRTISARNSAGYGALVFGILLNTPIWEQSQVLECPRKRVNLTASLLITRLQAGSRQHPLAQALIEYGKLQRTNHALRWFTDEAFRRRISRQLNRGESLNGLRRYLFFANRGEIIHQRQEDQTTQAHCHTLLTNASILWTTLYLGHAVTAHRNEGHHIEEHHLAHISPARFKHINPYRTYTFNVQDILQQCRRRPSTPFPPIRRRSNVGFGADTQQTPVREVTWSPVP